MFEYDIKIAFINVKIQSNLDIGKFIIEPEPYNLCINYCIKEAKNDLKHSNGKVYYSRTIDEQNKVIQDLISSGKWNG